MMRTQIFSLLLIVASTAPAFADAKADKAKAIALYDEGLRHYNVAEYPEAIAAWKQAYLLSKKPLLLFNLGQAYRLSGDCKQAMTFYDSYQREEPSPKNQADLDEALKLCATVAVDKPVDKPVVPVIDKPVDKPVVPVTDKPVVADPPVVTAPPVITDRPGVVTPPPVDTSSPAPEGQSHGSTRTAGIVIGGAGIVLTGVGVYFGLAARNLNDKLDHHTGEWQQTDADDESASSRDVKLGVVFGGLGAAAVITGGVLFVIGGRAADHVAVSPTHDGAAFVWNGRF